MNPHNVVDGLVPMAHTASKLVI